MPVRINISAGELFELIRPAAIVLSGFVSTWVLVSARKRFSIFASLLWAICALAFPLIVVPLYWAVLLLLKPKLIETGLRWRFVGPILYLFIVLTASISYLYFPAHNVDTHLFKAVQAKVNGDTVKAIAEYRKALMLEENPHTRKLLAMEYYKSGDRENALNELRKAEAGGEPDDSLHLLIGTLLEELNRNPEAVPEYQLFLSSDACLNQPIDIRCEAVKAKLSGPQFNSGNNRDE